MKRQLVSKLDLFGRTLSLATGFVLQMRFVLTPNKVSQIVLGVSTSFSAIKKPTWLAKTKWALRTLI